MYAYDTTIYCVGNTIGEVSVALNRGVVRLVCEEQADTTPKEVRMHANSQRIVH